MKLLLVIPAYNEEEIIVDSANRLKEYMEDLQRDRIISRDSRIVFVNDGSKDRTRLLLDEICDTNRMFTAIHFSRNYGHQYAVLAGYDYALDKCDACISLDADLQQDINAIRLFIAKFQEGNDIVLGVRKDRSTDGFFKRITSQGFYRIMTLFGSNTIPNHADYRLLSNKALHALHQYSEESVFLRGMVPSLGFKTALVEHDVYDRAAGSSKYTLKKMLTLASDGIVSYSDKPIILIASFGFAFFLIGLIGLIVALIVKAASPFLALAFFVTMLTGILMVSLGVIGIYVAKTMFETKKRPRYLIDEIVNDTKGFNE